MWSALRWLLGKIGEVEVGGFVLLGLLEKIASEISVSLSAFAFIIEE